MVDTKKTAKGSKGAGVANVIQSPEENNERPLLRNNFIMMAIAGILIVLGFILMAGSASGTDAYNPDIFSTRRIVVGPIMSFIGFVFMAVAIIVKPKSK